MHPLNLSGLIFLFFIIRQQKKAAIKQLKSDRRPLKKQLFSQPDSQYGQRK